MREKMKWNGADEQMKWGFNENFDVQAIVRHVKDKFFADEYAIESISELLLTPVVHGQRNNTFEIVMRLNFFKPLIAPW